MNLAELRKQANLTVLDVSKKLKRKPQTIYKYESSFRLPSFHILTQMSDIYKVDFEIILEAYENHKKEFLEKEKRYGRNHRELN